MQKASPLSTHPSSFEENISHFSSFECCVDPACDQPVTTNQFHQRHHNAFPALRPWMFYRPWPVAAQVTFNEAGFEMTLLSLGLAPSLCISYKTWSDWSSLSIKQLLAPWNSLQTQLEGWRHIHPIRSIKSQRQGGRGPERRSVYGKKVFFLGVFLRIRIIWLPLILSLAKSGVLTNEFLGGFNTFLWHFSDKGHL